MSPRSLAALAVLGVAFAAGACTSRRLVPETPVQAKAGGVHVEVDPEAWHGASNVPLELTPVHLTLYNDSGRDVYFTRQDVALVGGSRVLWALSPDTIEPHPMRTTLGIEPGTPLTPPPIPPGPINDLAIQQSGRRDSAPPNAFQGFTYREPMVPYGEGLEDPAQQEIRDAALQDGVIPAGKRVSGFVYFERLPKVDRLDLRIKLRTAINGSPVATITIPYQVRR